MRISRTSAPGSWGPATAAPLLALLWGCTISVPALDPDPTSDGGPDEGAPADQRVEGSPAPDSSIPTIPTVTQLGASAALKVQWSTNDEGWVAIERVSPGCGDTCTEEVLRSETSITRWVDETVSYDVPYSYRIANRQGVGGLSEPVTPRRVAPSVTFGSTPIFAEEFNDASFWGTADTSTSGHWRSFAGEDGRWLEGYNEPARASLVDRPGAVRALALESRPMIRSGSTVSWCRWAMSEAAFGTIERDKAIDRCRVHTAYLRTYQGWQGGAQQGPKFGPGTKVAVRVSFAEAIRPGQRFGFALLVEKPAALYTDEEAKREQAGAGGVAYDGLAENGAAIDLVALGHGHRSWDTPSSSLADVSRFYAGVHYDRRAPYDPVTNPEGRSGSGAIERTVDTLNVEQASAQLSHLAALHGNGPQATFDLRQGWLIFTLEWVETGPGQSRLDFYVQPDNGAAGEARYKYLVIDDFQLHDTSGDHFLVLANQVDQALTRFADSVWRYIEEDPDADGFNTSTSTTKVMTAEGEWAFDVYPADRLLIDWVRVYAQQ